MNKFIFSFKHSLGTYFNLVTSINNIGVVEYEYYFCPNYIYNPENYTYCKDLLNEEESNKFIKNIEDAQITEMDQNYERIEQLLDNRPECNFALIDGCNSNYVYIEGDCYPKSFEYIINAIDIINDEFVFWYKGCNNNCS